jgi:formylglycine-generating enzyme
MQPKHQQELLATQMKTLIDVSGKNRNGKLSRFILVFAVALALQGCNKTPIDIIIDNPNDEKIVFQLDEQEISIDPRTSIVHRTYEGDHLLNIGDKKKKFTLSSPEHNGALLNPTERFYVLKENLYQQEGEVIAFTKLNEIRRALNKNRSSHEQLLLADTIDFHGLYITSGFLLKVGDLVIPRRWDYGIDEELPKTISKEYVSTDRDIVKATELMRGYQGKVKLYRTNDYVREMFGNETLPYSTDESRRWAHISGSSLLESEEAKAFVKKFNLRTDKSEDVHGAYLFNEKVALHFWLDAGYLMCEYYDLKNLRWSPSLDDECVSEGVISKKKWLSIYKQHEAETKDGDFPAPMMFKFRYHLEVFSTLMPDFMEGNLKRYDKFMRVMEDYHRIAMEEFNIAHEIPYEKNDPLLEDQGPHKIDTKPELVLVKGGTFTMGSDSELDFDKPPHQVTVSSYSIGKFEISVGQYKAFCDATGRQMPEAPRWGWVDRHPIVNVSSYDAIDYCKWLSEKFGGNWRLPTEAEWEFAARGGTRDRESHFSGSDYIDNVAWYLTTSVGRTHPVGLKKPNELGIYDMTGNVYEWINDWYDKYPAEPQVDPKGPAVGTSHALRGGAWNTWEIKIVRRGGAVADDRSQAIGFRVAYSR